MKTIQRLAACVFLIMSANVVAAFDYWTEITWNDAAQLYDSMTGSASAFFTQDGEKTKVFVHYERVG
jgi:hypothetical protein